MSIVSAKTLRDALHKAKGIGIVEDRFTVADCEVVIRSLRPDEYTAILAEVQGLDNVAYLNAFQLGHICRSIVEINGQDFRDVSFIEEEEPDPKKPGQIRNVKVELHTWLLKNVLASWGKEAIFTAYRKVGEVIEKAEEKAKEGIQFKTEDEPVEEKFRRLLGEAQASEEALPDVLVDRILEEFGYTKKTKAEDVKAALDRVEAAIPKTEEVVEAPPTQPEPVEKPVRQPLNRIPVEVPQPEGVSRAAQMAALEADADEAGVLSYTPESAPAAPEQAPAPVFTGVEKLNPAAARIDALPKGGVNPHFRAPRRF